MSLVVIVRVIPRHLRCRDQRHIFILPDRKQKIHKKKRIHRERERMNEKEISLLNTGVGILTNFPFVTRYDSVKITPTEVSVTFKENCNDSRLFQPLT